ncbi:MAG TPA: putative glycolipid-binding domain-containing protein [Rugosimonospora sp.]|nr:putative glycolipid-binding domain-containing protein [Rugosimonospora sp.]
MRYSSGTFAADLTVDADGYVRDYPGLAVRD